MSREILKAQNLRLAVVCFGTFFAMFGIYHVAFQDGGISSLPPVPQHVDLPIDKVNVQDIWMNKQDRMLSRIEIDKQLSDQKVKVLEEEILKGKKKEEEEEKGKFELNRLVSSLRQEIKQLSEKVEKQEQRTEIAQVSHIENIDKTRVKRVQNRDFSKDPFVRSDGFFAPLQNKTIEGEFEDEQRLKPHLREVSMAKKEKKVFSVKKKVPAGVSVRALLVSSVDAVCGVYSNSDPVPIKLRLLEDGHLPKGVDVDLRGCIVLGSAFGNISNERVYMRLERLTKVNPKGEAIETEVTGYVSGEDGKFGVRGFVVDRSGKIIKNAAASGILGSVAQVLQASVAKQPVDCWNNYATGVDVAKQGVASGTSSAFDMLADYYIRRAEQVQPVLQVSAGRIVDITFTHGFEMGDLDTKKKVTEVRNRSRRLSCAS